MLGNGSGFRLRAVGALGTGVLLGGRVFVAGSQLPSAPRGPGQG